MNLRVVEAVDCDCCVIRGKDFCQQMLLWGFYETGLCNVKRMIVRERVESEETVSTIMQSFGERRMTYNT